MSLFWKWKYKENHTVITIHVMGYILSGHGEQKDISGHDGEGGG